MKNKVAHFAWRECNFNNKKNKKFVCILLNIHMSNEISKRNYWWWCSMNDWIFGLLTTTCIIAINRKYQKSQTLKKKSIKYLIITCMHSLHHTKNHLFLPAKLQWRWWWWKLLFTTPQKNKHTHGDMHIIDIYGIY